MSLIFLSKHHWARASKIAKFCKISEKLNDPLLFFGTLEKIWVCFTLGRGQNLSERLPGIDQVPDTFFRLSSPNYCILQLPRNQLHWAGQRQNTLFWGRYRKKVLAPPGLCPGAVPINFASSLISSHDQIFVFFAGLAYFCLAKVGATFIWRYFATYMRPLLTTCFCIPSAFISSFFSSFWKTLGRQIS